MDDLAGEVLAQLRIKDGHGPFALLYEDELKYRVLVSNVKRVDGVLLYEHAYVDLRSEESRAASAKGERIEWDFVAFTDVDAAAYFALAFMQHNNPYAHKHMVTTFHADKVRPLFERGESNRFFVPFAHENEFNLYEMPRGQLGCRVGLDQEGLRAGLVSLMPVSE